MNLIEQLKKELAPTLHKVTLSNGVELYVRKPKLSEFEKCNTTKDTLLYCVCDSTGYEIFADGEQEGKVDVNSISSDFAAELFEKCIDLWKTGDDAIEEVEKK